MDVFDWWRLINFSLGLVALVWLVYEVVPSFVNMSTRVKYIILSMVMLLGTSAWSSAESFVQDTQVGLRVPLTTAACVWVIIAVTTTPPEYRPKRHRMSKRVSSK